MERERGGREMARMRRMLKDLAEMAEHATLTGSMEGGERSAVRRYNAVLAWLEGEEIIPSGFFQPLPENTEFGELAVESRMLLGYLKDNGEEMPEPELAGEKKKKRVDMGMIVGLAPFLDRRELVQLVRANMPGQTGGLDPGLVVALAPFIGREELGRIIREHLPEWFRGQEVPVASEDAAPDEGEPVGADTLNVHAAHPAHPGHPTMPVPPVPPTPPAPPVPPVPGGDHAPDAGVRMRLAEIGEQLHQAAERLKRGDLSDEERVALAEEMGRLGQEQARLARWSALSNEDIS